MKSILEELWRGNIHPYERVGGLSEEEKELTGYISRHYEELESVLNEKQKSVLEKYSDCLTELSFINEKEIFVEGFCLGAKIMLEVMTA